jgi:hypothetical protein
MQGLVNAAVMVVAVIIKPLHLQVFKKRIHMKLLLISTHKVLVHMLRAQY